MASDRLLTIALAASMLACGGTLGVGRATHRTSDAANSSVIPQWKVDLLTTSGPDWWSKYGPMSVIHQIKSAIWGDGLPEVTGSPAQNQQHCPIIKLPEDFIIAAKRRSWTGLYGEWNTASGVSLATWEQNYLSMGFSHDIKQVGVHVRSSATRQVAIRIRYFSDEEMLRLYGWKERRNLSTPSSKNVKPFNGTNATHVKATASLNQEKPFNLAIFDCMGTLMYVVKETSNLPKYIRVYSRDATLLAQTTVGAPILRYEFVDPKSGYLIGTMEAPGINASIRMQDIPRDAEVAGVLPFGFHFEKGGYANSSALMQPEYHWILAAAVQALAIYRDVQPVDMPWSAISIIEAYYIIGIIVWIFAVFGLFHGIYRCVYPALPIPAKNYDVANAAMNGQYTRNFGLHSRALGYGANK